MSATVIDTPEGIAMFRLLQIKFALRLELQGLRFSHGRVSNIARQELRKEGVAPPRDLNLLYLLFDQLVQARLPQ